MDFVVVQQHPVVYHHHQHCTNRHASVDQMDVKPVSWSHVLDSIYPNRHRLVVPATLVYNFFLFDLKKEKKGFSIRNASNSQMNATLKLFSQINVTAIQVIRLTSQTCTMYNLQSIQNAVFLKIDLTANWDIIIKLSTVMCYAHTWCTLYTVQPKFMRFKSIWISIKCSQQLQPQTININSFQEP